MSYKLELDYRPILGSIKNYKTYPFMRQIVEMGNHLVRDADPIIREIFDSMYNCADIEEFDQNRQKNSYQILHDACSGGDNSLGNFVYSLYLYHINNHEMALANAAHAAFIDEEYRFFHMILFLIIYWEMNIPESVNDMLTMYYDRSPLDYYYKKSWEHLFQDNMDGFDHYIQRINAWSFQPTLFFSHSRILSEAMVKNGHWEGIKRDWMEETKKTFLQSKSEEGARNDAGRWEEDENKDFIARHIIGLYLNENIGRPRILEIGCHAGALLGHIERGMYKYNNPGRFVGIEPNERAVNIGKEKYPFIDFHVGTHEIALAGDFSGDVLLFSFMCLLNPTETIQEIFNWAGGRFKHIVIVDDIVNMYGDFPVFRRYYMIHPYKQMLEKAGFTIIEKFPLPRYTVAANGLICAKYLENS